jgi:rubrerythrin
VKGFVARQNIEHYRELLKITTDPAERRMIEQLLVDEEAKLKKYDEKAKKT